MSEQPTALARVEVAHRALTEARDLPEVLAVLKMAEAVEAVLRLEKMGIETQNMAAELVIRAKRKGGELLREMPKNPGGQAEHSSYLLPDGTGSARPPTLPELGITRKQSFTWQHIADIPEDRFEQHIEETKAASQELTTAGVLRLADEQKVVDITPPPSKPSPLASVPGMDEWDQARRKADTVLVAISYANALLRMIPARAVSDLAGAANPDEARTELLACAERAASWGPAVLRMLSNPDDRGLRVVQADD